MQLLATLRQSGSAVTAWTSERAPLRVVIVRWLLLGLGIVALVAAWGGLSASNLARHATVTMSSNCGILPPYTRSPVEPMRLVDGKTDRSYDACTTVEPEPWLVLDLGQLATLHQAVIAGRADCCWAWSTLPLLLELSEDGQNYELVRQKRVPFTRDSPWRANLGHKPARYVRLRVEPGANGSASEIVLSEVEIYGAVL